MSTTTKGPARAKQSAISLEVFPNPSSGALHIEYVLAESAPVVLTVADLSGKTVWSRNFEASATLAGKNDIDIVLDQPVDSSVVIVTLTSGNSSVSRRIVMAGQ